MANIFEGIFNMITGLFQSIFAIFQSFFNIIYAFFHGIFTTVFDLLEGVAHFVGASVNFVISNIVILGLLGVAFIIWQDRAKRANVPAGAGGKKKVA